MWLRSIEVGTERESWAPDFPNAQICGRDIKMANSVNTTSASPLEKCETLLQEVVTELNWSTQIPRESPPDLLPSCPAKLTTFLSELCYRRFLYHMNGRKRHECINRENRALSSLRHRCYRTSKCDLALERKIDVTDGQAHFSHRRSGKVRARSQFLL